uniref:Homeodomain-only protein n=1 Tax=Canis lupus familiaris TaxID=9615 RepID=A0A8I3NRI5_CANLF
MAGRGGSLALGAGRGGASCPPRLSHVRGRRTRTREVGPQPRDPSPPPGAAPSPGGEAPEATLQEGAPPPRGPRPGDPAGRSGPRTRGSAEGALGAGAGPGGRAAISIPARRRRRRAHPAAPLPRSRAATMSAETASGPTEDQVEILEYNFSKVNKHPDPTTLCLIAAEAGLSEEETQKWFKQRLAQWRQSEGLPSECRSVTD